MSARMWIFARRNAREILRDPLTLCFGIGFPAVLLILLSVIQSNVPVELFEIEHLAPGTQVFGLSFLTLFSATLVSKDRTGAFLQRLYTTPLTASDFILGYTLPLIPMGLAQGVFCYGLSLLLGLKWSLHLLPALLLALPSILFFIALGLLFGSILTDKQAGGICGALLTNLTAWFSGTYFDLALVGGAFEAVANHLPFVHAVKLEQLALLGDLPGALPHLLWVISYAMAAMTGAILLFLRQMRRN